MNGTVAGIGDRSLSDTGLDRLASNGAGTIYGFMAPAAINQNYSQWIAAAKVLGFPLRQQQCCGNLVQRDAIEGATSTSSSPRDTSTFRASRRLRGSVTSQRTLRAVPSVATEGATSGNHTVYDCKKQTCCRVCKKRHHSLLHLNREPNSEADGQNAPTKAAIDIASSSTSDNIVACFSTGRIPKVRQVLLATALVKAESSIGEVQIVRALLDQGSQACFITEATVQLLRLKKIPVHGVVSGLGNDRSTISKHMVNLTIKSTVDHEFQLTVKAYVLSKITSYLPERSINPSSLEWINIKGMSLADPYCNTPNRIDVLLGADAYCDIVKEGIVKGPSGSLIVQNTSLGWVLSGVVSLDSDYSEHHSKNISVHCAQFNEENLLKQFWEIEEMISTKKILTPEEQKCEDLYIKTTKRDDTGRYIVRLPFRDQDPACKGGNSRDIAEIRFKSLEKRLNKNTELKEQYTKVINEYLQLGHMRAVKEGDSNKNNAVYLPHHAVIREDKTTTKVRVVFNASEKNKNGISLNDTLMVGPTLQADLRHTVMKWRVHRIGIVADIIKMYRQVRIADEDAIFQRILWRDSPEKPIRDYELITVTFGTASAPYQAVRSLHQVAYDEGDKYPLATERVLHCFYMDDLMVGCNSLEEGVEVCKQLNELLGKGGFRLQKWNSNDQELLDKISSININKVVHEIGQTNIETEENKGRKERLESKLESKDIEIKLDSTIKILGLTWNRREDCFQYSVTLSPLSSSPVTKRSIISDIARLFDPLGWLAPSVVLAKIFIQELWLTGVNWDEQLNDSLVTKWRTYREELSLLKRVQVPRWIRTTGDDNIELHGFSDASKAAYAAVVYLRTINLAGEIHVSLLVAKTRVAPIKQVSIPRLELCGAVLLSKLLTEATEVLNISKDKVFAWTDSTVVLSWLSSHPSRWKTFVANRTSEILGNISSTQWFHVSTKENPADCASRGLNPSSLVESKLWFSGPPFLKNNLVEYKRPKELKTELEQIKVHTAVVTDKLDLDKYSSLSKLVRVVAYCRRFLKKDKHGTRYLTVHEIEAALQTCIKKVQIETFSTEYTQLKEKGYLTIKSSKLKSLCPFLDKMGIIRIRGRVEKSELAEQVKHPIVLPHSHHLTHLIVADAHEKTLHGGPQLMANFLRSAYWIIGARSLIQQYVRKCVTCAKQRANVKNQLMGDLPSVRCIPARPFLHSGVDYAGPISIRTSKGRGHRAYKGYICLFVCMTTRAIHLEVVSDMTTQAFLAAFRRFVSRRGHCAKLWSDNGTNFVGASRELQQLASIQPAIAEHLEANNTEWHFIPPHAPNFGGLWEAGVKSTKFHLKRVIGESTLTYEEMSTFLNQVEACLNSRPISVLNISDPGEPLPLTPGHFLIGEPLVNVPDKNYESSNVNYLTRWQYVQRMLQSFWRRWSHEYLSNLMNRYKWSLQVPEPKLGDIVLIKEDDLPPSRWLLGRVVQKHPGNDNLTRVVTLRTNTTTIKRPTNKLCILPIVD
nr:uncharacterized protein LOC126054685 [Helicoverpa armigera]